MLTDSMELQLALEQKSLEEGRNRYLKQQEQREEDQGYGARRDVSKLIKGCLPILAESIANYLEGASNRGKGRTAIGVSFLQELSPDLLASLTLSGAFDSLRQRRDGKPTSLTH